MFLGHGLDWWTAVGTVGSAAGALFAVLVALWLGLFGPRRVTKPKLKVSIEMKAPDCHKINATASYQLMGATIPGTIPQYYCRLRVGNDGNEEARDVEVQLIRLWRLDGDGKRAQDPVFIPLSLVWSHSNPPVSARPKLLPGLFRHCDLCHVSRPPDQREAEIEFNTEVRPNEFRPGEWPTLKPPGEYQLEFGVAASNAKTIYRTAAIHFTGQWREPEEEMLGHELRVTLSKTE